MIPFNTHNVGARGTANQAEADAIGRRALGMDGVQQQIEATRNKLRELKAQRARMAAQAREAAKADALDMTVEQMQQYSRQYLWQLRKIIQGKCAQCGGPSNGHRECDTCASRHTGTVPKRHVLPEQWQMVDWSRPAADIAKELGVSLLTVHDHRPLQFRRPRGRPRKDKQTSCQT